jgi:hypothetical protein
MKKLLLAFSLLLFVCQANAQTYPNMYSPWMPWDPRLKYTGTMSLLDASGAEVNKTPFSSLFNTITVVFPVQAAPATVPKVHVLLNITGTNDKGVVDLVGTTAFDYTLSPVYAAVAGSNPTFVYSPMGSGMSFSPLLVASAPMPVVPPPPVADTTPPTVSITAPLAGATIVGTNPLTASASDNVGVVGLQFLIDGVNFSAEITAPPYATFWNSTIVADGAHTVSATARDAAGNRATSALVSVKVSNAPPPPPPPPPPPGISADGSKITPVSGGSLTTTAGVWTFGTIVGAGGNIILLNGKQAASGESTELYVLNGGNLYAFNSFSNWFQWVGTGWNRLTAAPTGAPHP